MDPVQISIPVRGFGETSRRDAWWVQPLVVFLAFSTFIVYATWAAYQGEHYYTGPYLSGPTPRHALSASHAARIAVSRRFRC